MYFSYDRKSKILDIPCTLKISVEIECDDDDVGDDGKYHLVLTTHICGFYSIRGVVCSDVGEMTPLELINYIEENDLEQKAIEDLTKDWEKIAEFLTQAPQKTATPKVKSPKKRGRPKKKKPQ